MASSDLVPCCAEQAPSEVDAWKMPRPAEHDEEGERVPTELPPVVDAHVHLFPDGLFRAIWRWFDTYGWPIRYKLEAPDVVRFLLDRGVKRAIALHYAHKPGIARSMNAFVADIARKEPRIIGCATVHPDDEDPVGILEEGKALGLRGVKLHCHVQTFAPDDPRLETIYSACARLRLPLVMHAGREPSSVGYPIDTHTLCAADRTERVLVAHPTLSLVVPHLGADEFDAYGRLLAKYDNLWLDTTMAVAGYFGGEVPWRLLDIRPERVLYGTDFPNLPYAWDRELKRIHAHRLSEQALAGLLGENAARLFGFPLV
ncbi:amidohydrolase family protein [Labilithrix luteola]|uniref:Amidohydrolase family protein n=1 Tax=Labilithrix luteola TaxID=1391654 RepID=A0A0K1QCZ1_9BACT|nr:amidohydrolase family protein [Labilithrix luteola]AKV03532.1 amidohydrolase family protein [Labilithrix luteola]